MFFIIYNNNEFTRHRKPLNNRIYTLVAAKTLLTRLQPMDANKNRAALSNDYMEGCSERVTNEYCTAEWRN